MTVFGRRLFVIPLLLLICTCVAWAAIAVSITTPYTQNFDAIGTPASAILPADFRVDKLSSVRTVGTYGAAGTTTNLAGGANLAANASNGIYNFGSGTTASGPDRSVGFLSSGTATFSGNLYAQVVNNTGGNLSGLQISYNVEKYRSGSNPAGFRIQMFYSTDGNAWTNAGPTFLTSFPADVNNNGFATAPGIAVPVSNQTLTVAIANGSNFYLAWNYSVSSGSMVTNAQALAIDDISILGIAGVTATNPTGVGAATPSAVQAGQSTLLTVTVTPGANPAGTGVVVTANLGAIGGLPTQPFFDDGTHGDIVAGDNVFSCQAAVPAATSAGGKNLPATITDAQGRSGNASIALIVTPASTSPTGVGSADPGSLLAGNDTQLTVTVTPGSNPISTGIGMVADLSSIGGSAAQPFYDDGTHGDATASNNVFSFQATVATGTAPSAKSLPVIISDAQGRSGATTIALTVQPPPPPTTVKISQVYGGGGNSGATYTNDFIEIYNQATTSIDLTFWSVQYSSAAGTTWASTPLCPQGGTCTLLPGHYYLVLESQGTGGTTGLPAPDAIGTILLSGTSGKVALVADAVALTGSCPTGGSLVDFVGYGGANCWESAPAAGLGNTTAAVRRGNGCVDTDNNAADFVTIGPIPRNSAAPANSCGGDPSQPSGLGIASPASLDPASNTLLTVKVTPASAPPSSGVSVTADLAAIGGAASQVLYDDGTHGDQAGGDNVFSFQAIVGAFTRTGAKNLVATLTDAEGRTATAPITLTVVSPTCGVERWSVKTGTDPNATQVDLENLVPAAIAALGVIPPPTEDELKGAFDKTRVPPAETTAYVVNATLTLYKKESDVDYHIVLQDDNGHTLIAEIPSPACVGASSPFASGVARARAKFDARLAANDRFQTANLPVQVTGVGFFDFEHGQTGIAPNGIELHPVLDINFTANTSTTLLSTANPSQYGQTVAIAATVTSSDTITPSGHVTFFDGAALLGGSILNPGGQATFTTSGLSVGSHVLTASYDGDSTSAPSASAPMTQDVMRADELIDFVSLDGKTFGDADFSVSATASSGLPVGFSIVSGPATIAGSTVHITGAGTVTVRAAQAGDGNYNAAPDVDRAFDVGKAGQAIAFAALPDKTYGDPPFTVTATGGGSGNPVTFSAVGVCTSAGHTITITTGGSCMITASQSGNSNYDAATDVVRPLTISRTAASIIINDYSDVYDGHAHGASGSATGVGGEDLTNLLSLGATFATVPGGIAHWTFAGDTNYAPAGGDATITITKATIAFSSLSAPTITDRITSATLGGRIQDGALIPTGSVAITLNGMTQNAAIHADGSFASSFATGSLTPSYSPYAIAYGYGGDTNFNATSGIGTLTVQDTTPPVIQSATPSPTIIWPPNKSMVPIAVAISAIDAVDPAPQCAVVGVTGNDGATSADWEIIGPASVRLRADRTGQGSGRSYQITVRCADASGNVATAVATVKVPHDQGK